MPLTPNQRAVLHLAIEGRMTEYAQIATGISKQLLGRMARQGLIRYRPYAQPALWEITDAGREALAATTPKGDR